MFTGNTKLLSEFESDDLTVLRDCEIAHAGKIETRVEKRVVPANKLSFIHKCNHEDGISAIITTEELAKEVPDCFGLALSNEPLASCLNIQEKIACIPDFQWKSFKSKIDPSAKIYPGAYIAENDVIIGANTIIHANAVILPRSIIGKYCSIGPGSVVSTEAFEVGVSSEPYKVLGQSGGVYIADFVDVQAKCTLVRSTFGGFTKLGEGTKLDCQVHFAHDCRTGKNVRIAACAEISGRVDIGDRVFIGPNVSISNGIVIEDDAKVTIGSVVTRNVPKGETVTGNFAVSHRKWLKFMRTLK